MLQTATEFPGLFTSTSTSSSSYSSCAAMIIQHETAPSGPFTFDWSDFPFVQRDDLILESSTSASAVSQTATPDVSPAKEALHEQDALSTCCSESELSSASTISSRRRVTFSPTMHVRTHSLVLGDHPCCAQLALELGWEYGESSADLMEKDRSALRRRSYFERKAILKEVVGMTDEEIRMTTLRHAAPSSRQLSAMQGIAV